MIYLIGSGGHSKVVVEALIQSGEADLKVLDSDAQKVGQSFLNFKIEHEEATLNQIQSPVSFFVAIGDPIARREVCERWLEKGHQLISVFHPQATISPSAKIASGTCIMAGAVVQAEAQVGRCSIINTNASVDHDCQLEEYVHVAPRAVLAGGVTVGRNSWVGLGAVVREGITIGANSLVGAGAVVIRNLPEKVEAYGVPAQVIRDYQAAL